MLWQYDNKCSIVYSAILKSSSSAAPGWLCRLVSEVWPLCLTEV
jgi:hypothetical protein